MDDQAADAMLAHGDQGAQRPQLDAHRREKRQRAMGEHLGCVSHDHASTVQRIVMRDGGIHVEPALIHA